jgi:hypothetical protein
MQYMESGQTLPAGQSCPMSCSVDGVWPVSSFLLDHHVLCPIQWMESGQPVTSCWTIMSYVLWSTWSLARPFELDHRVLCPVQCMESGQSVPFLLDIMSYALCPAHCREWKHRRTKGTLTKMSTRWRTGVSFTVMFEEANGNGRCFIQPGPNSRRPPEAHQLSHWLVQRI